MFQIKDLTYISFTIWSFHIFFSYITSTLLRNAWNPPPLGSSQNGILHGLVENTSLSISNLSIPIHSPKTFISPKLLTQHTIPSLFDQFIWFSAFLNSFLIEFLIWCIFSRGSQNSVENIFWYKIAKLPAPLLSHL